MQDWSPEEAARMLVGSFETILAIDAAQQEQVDAMRSRAEGMASFMQAALQRRREALEGGEPSAPPAPGTPGLPGGFRESAQQVQERHRSGAELSLRRETAVCDIHDALLRLAAEPSVQGEVSQLAALLREIRLLGSRISLEEATQPPAMPTFEPRTAPLEGADRLAFAQDFLHSMDTTASSIGQRLAEAGKQETRHWQEGLALAQALAAKLTP